MRRVDKHVTKRVMGMNVDGWKRKAKERRWMDCVTNDMLEKGVDNTMTANRGEWRKMTCCPDPE